MAKKAKILVTAAVLTIGTTVVGHAAESKPKIQSNTNVKNIKLLVDKKINNLSNKTIMTRSWTQYGNNIFTGASLTFNTTDMKLQFSQDLQVPWVQNANNDNYVTYELFNNNLQSQGSIRENNNGTISTKGGSWTSKSFNYNDILYINAGASTLPSLYNKPNKTFVYSAGTPLSNGYYKITPQGLIVMNGLYKTVNGNIYYFENGKMLTNVWANVNSEGNRVSTNPNGTTINAYYLGSNGAAEKGLQRINGKLQYLNPTTGAMELNKFITINNNKYYLQPINGIAATGWQTINNKKYYFNPQTGIMQTNLQTISGNKYYFDPQTGEMLTNVWVNINSEGNRVSTNPNGTTINAYYLGSNGAAEKGLQRINGKLQYLNPTTGAMELNKFITINNNKYYLQPINGIAATGWQTINNKKYYFNPQTGIMQTGFKKINDFVYQFNNAGELIGKVTIAINGATNKSISLGSQFNPLEGITLNDIADPTAKIQVSGIVNVNIPGVYTLTYTVTDSYGQTTTVTREITVTSNKTSNTEDIYWSQGNIVINGNVDSSNILSQSVKKNLVIINSNGKIINSINTVPINWYSNNKENYSGFQGIISPNVLSTLKSNDIYKLYIEVNGEYIPLISKINSPYNKNYLLNVNSANQLTINKIDNTVNPINAGTASYEIGYFTSDGYVINGDLSLNNTVFNKSITKLLLIKDAQGNIVDTLNCASMNWYSINKNNYSGFQGIIPYSVLDKLEIGESYNLSLETIIDGKVYETPISNTKGFILNDSIQYNVLTNSKNNITITKNKTYPVINSGTGIYQNGYWAPYGYVMNIKADIEKEIPKGTKIQLISKNLNGEVVSVTTGTNVNWYSNNKNNYNGIQAIITPKQLVMASTSNKLYLRITIDGKTYESPVTGELDIYGSKALNYGFKTINNQINLIINN